MPKRFRFLALLGALALTLAAFAACSDDGGGDDSVIDDALAAETPDIPGSTPADPGDDYGTGDDQGDGNGNGGNDDGGNGNGGNDDGGNNNGGDDGGVDNGGDPNNPTIDGHVTATDFEYDITTLYANGGERFELTFQNNGSTTHSFTAPELNAESAIVPGSTQVIYIDVPASGTFEYHCKFHPDQMKGTLKAS